MPAKINYTELDIFTVEVIAWNIAYPSLLKANQHFGGTCRLHLQDKRISQALDMGTFAKLVSCLGYSTALKLVAMFLQRTTQHYIPEDELFRRLVFGSVSCVFDTCDVLMIAILCIYVMCI
jgi:hypothetical protein